MRFHVSRLSRSALCVLGGEVEAELAAGRTEQQVRTLWHDTYGAVYEPPQGHRAWFVRMLDLIRAQQWAEDWSASRPDSSLHELARSFHRDYDLEATDADSAVREFLDASQDRAASLVDEIDAVVAARRSEDDLEALWAEVYGSNYDPSKDHFAYGVWFQHLGELARGAPPTWPSRPYRDHRCELWGLLGVYLTRLPAATLAAADDVVREYLRQHVRSEAEDLADEIVWLLARAPSDEQLALLWALQFESDFDPEPVGFDRRGWLVHVLELVMTTTRRFPRDFARYGVLTTP